MNLSLFGMNVCGLNGAISVSHVCASHRKPGHSEPRIWTLGGIQVQFKESLLSCWRRLWELLGCSALYVDTLQALSVSEYPLVI